MNSRQSLSDVFLLQGGDEGPTGPLAHAWLLCIHQSSFCVAQLALRDDLSDRHEPGWDFFVVPIKTSKGLHIAALDASAVFKLVIKMCEDLPSSASGDPFPFGWQNSQLNHGNLWQGSVAQNLCTLVFCSENLETLKTGLPARACPSPWRLVARGQSGTTCLLMGNHRVRTTGTTRTGSPVARCCWRSSIL